VKCCEGFEYIRGHKLQEKDDATNHHQADLFLLAKRVWEKEIVVIANIPGVNSRSVNITVEKNVLMINAFG